MRVLDRRLRRLEEGLLPPPETAESRRVGGIAFAIRRARARASLGTARRAPRGAGAGAGARRAVGGGGGAPDVRWHHHLQLPAQQRR